MAQVAALLAFVDLWLVFGMVEDAFFSDAYWAGLGAALTFWPLLVLGLVTVLLGAFGSVDGRRGGPAAGFAVVAGGASIVAAFLIRWLAL